MFVFRRPTEDRVREYLLSLKNAPLRMRRSAARGIRGKTKPTPPGFNRDHERVLLGKGGDVLLRACRAIQSWQMMPPSVVQPCPTGVPIEEGAMVANLFRAGRWEAGWCCRRAFCT